MNNKSIKRLIVRLLLVFLPFNLMAEIKLPAILSDNMVLQQQSNPLLWGEAKPFSVVKVVTSWNNKDYKTKAGNDGSWKVQIETPEAGGPYEITIEDNSKLTIKNVLIGEVWYCSGQSNMGMPLRGHYNAPVLNSNEVIAKSTNESIRLFTVGRKTSFEPLTNAKGQWDLCEPKNVGDFSATAYFFGQMLQEALHVPVGLINSSWGGTNIETWMSPNSIKQFDFINIPSKDETDRLSEAYPKTPSLLFNGMVSPILDFTIRGVIWYQGEDNVTRPAEYQKLLPSLIEGWREEWGIGEFPFYYAQITPFYYGSNLNSAFLREAQLKALEKTQNTGMACLLDVGEEAEIHPSNKKAVGQRLAFLALSKTYDVQKIESSGPILKDITIHDNIAELTFDHASKGLTSFGRELSNFEIAGANKRFFNAKAFITKKGRVRVYSDWVAKPVAVRYAFKNFVVGDLYNTEGLPASSFRTDDWEE
ncbi:sialate O-acetylesterase [Sunxiuqinia indica]|uniref:sialate O-acetylesterase n=1 Tax=Sunxiuqinia indica TaxID=2692584 RepID=UPI001914EFDC|nr:sialate O-acetylesterase [Sunxiuqinia indica]